MGDPRRERPPDMYGHVINVPTHPNVKLPAIGGHLHDADSHLLVVRTCYNGQFKQIPRFRLSFQPKIDRGAHLKLRSTVRSNSHAANVPSGDRKQCFISQTLWLHSFVLRHHVVCVKPAMSKKRTIRSFDQCASCRTRAIEMLRKNENSTYRSKPSGHKELSWSSGIRTGGRSDMKYAERQKLT